MKQTQNSSSISKIPVISLSISFCSSKSKLIFSTYILSFLPILLLGILATLFAVFVSKLSVRWSLYFVEFGFPFSLVQEVISIIIKWNKLYISSNTTILHFMNIKSIKYNTVLFDAVYILCHFVFPCKAIVFTLATVCSIYAVDQSCNYSQTVSPLHFAKYKGIYRLYLLPIHVRLLVFWSIRSIAAICSIIIINFHYFPILAYCIAFIFVNIDFSITWQIW